MFLVLLTHPWEHIPLQSIQLGFHIAEGRTEETENIRFTGLDFAGGLQLLGEFVAFSLRCCQLAGLVLLLLQKEGKCLPMPKDRGWLGRRCEPQVLQTSTQEGFVIGVRDPRRRYRRANFNTSDVYEPAHAIDQSGKNKGPRCRRQRHARHGCCVFHGKRPLNPQERGHLIHGISAGDSTGRGRGVLRGRKPVVASFLRSGATGAISPARVSFSWTRL